MDEVVVEAAMPGAVVGDIPPENRLNPAQIAAYGDSTINDLLNDIAQQTQSDQGRGGTAPIILVNGKRVSGVNEVGDLPTESILRVDILPEEVALRYGYGAQQKVVNIILRRNFRAKLFDLTGSESTEGGGESDMADANYSRIHGNDRVNVVARVRTQESILESDRVAFHRTAGTVSDPTGSIGNDSDARTLEPATNTYSLNSVFAHSLSESLQGSFNAMATYQTTRAKDGYPAAILDVPAGTPYAREDADATVDRYLSGATLHQNANTGAAHAGVTLNADLPLTSGDCRSLAPMTQRRTDGDATHIRDDQLAGGDQCRLLPQPAGCCRSPCWARWTAWTRRRSPTLVAAVSRQWRAVQGARR